MAATPANSLTLVSTGLADTRLQPPKGRPDINQFVKVLHKTTRYASQWNRVEFDGSVEFGQRVTVTVPRIGELVSGFMVVVEMPDIYTLQLAAIKAAGGTSLTNRGNFLGPLFGWTNSLGHALIDTIQLEIGGAIVETLDGRLLEMLDELYETLESAQAKNAMIKRQANGYTSTTFLTPTNTKVYIPIPFWFSRPGVYSHALPIDALQAELVRIHVTFRPLSQIYYTEARPTPTTAPPLYTGAMLPITGAQWWQSNATSTISVSQLSAAQGTRTTPASKIPGLQFPLKFSPTAAYAMIEYISLDVYEAQAFRSSELTYQVEQHQAVTPQPTLGQQEVRFEVPYMNPVKEILWVFQRPEAQTYNAWFLFTQDLGPYTTPYATVNPCAIPWWPDAVLTTTKANDYRVLPGFRDSMSEPLAAATLLYNTFERFVHDGGSFFRGIVPAQYYTKSAVINRYIYAYNFGKKMGRLTYGPSGAANWDKLTHKEMYMTLAKNRTGSATPNLNLYAYITNWNVFKVFGGRGGMLFSN